ncbi:uncharacterized protein MONBRDRAFT_26551 [Monosiga brevicollis MX1]|uniref:DUF155 domain-containing protein n=1 Tax=Monosiga brevicollis TaxID=81824 RepID=A9V2P7_MONBE|nr:uncharacterized protein MONBRDRAFT_26551 [Monosiga brevicollis MX1]EDQ88410.1 predicted protein [Monosiga brevicollis MX1]|eukprot:XP_001747003.1 hypothetical protein [Monosiga brevicollis MX1]
MLRALTSRWRPGAMPLCSFRALQSEARAKTWEVHALKTARSYSLPKLDSVLARQTMFVKTPFVNELAQHVRHITLNYDNNADHQRVFIFSSGAIIAWGLRPNVLRALFSLLRAVESDPISQRLAEQEHEILLYTLDGGQRSFLRKGLIHLADQDLPTTQHEHDYLAFHSSEDAQVGDRSLEQFAVSHAVALSIELGILETELATFAQKIEWITNDIKEGRELRISRSTVLQLYGELLSLRHNLNRSTELSDFYWDREELEVLFDSACRFLDIEARRRLCNERVSYHSELAELLRITLSERHSTLLEWGIIGLITVEVAFELMHYAERWLA